MKSAFIYTPGYSLYDYGPAHPMKTLRLKLCYDLLAAYNIFHNPDVKIIEPVPADRTDVIAIHDEGYIKALEAASINHGDSSLYTYGLGFSDNPAFRGVYDWSMLYTGGSIQAVNMVESAEYNAAFNIAGGLHHAMPGKASGFCYINDAAVAINKLIKHGMRVAYIDIDAHHGDGVQHIFYNTNKALTISLHESGEFLFPGTGYTEEIGEGDGMGYSVNLPFYPGTGDSVFVWGFEQVVPPLIEAYKPDFIVTQLGVDSMATDPLAHLNLTTQGFCRMIERMRSFNIPWIALGGGGYNLSNVARAWALAFGIMCNIELPDEIPDACVDTLRRHGREGSTLRDKETLPDDETTRRWAEGKVGYIQKRVFPYHIK